MRPLRISALAGLLAVALAGCSSRPVVTGKVTYKGTTLTAGEVSFVSPDGKSSRSGQIGSDGQYEVVDPPRGQVTILVVATKVEGGSAKGSKPFAGDTKAKPGTVRSTIPLKYSDPRTSGLSFSVTGGRQTKDVELE